MLISLLVLSFLIFFHELGHFLAARFFGVKVEVFSIGFGKKILKRRWGETEYCLSAIPLGGYVQMKGQDDSNPTNTSLDADSYGAKTPLQRIAILFAGPFANFLLAFLLYIAIASLGVLKLAPQIGVVSEDSAASAAGLMEKDRIVAINGTSIRIWDEIKPIVTQTQGSISLLVERADETLLLSLTPKLSQSQTLFGEAIQERLIGISPSGETVTLTFRGVQSLGFAWHETVRAATLIVQSLQKMIEGVISPKEMGGVISIVQITSSAADAGIVTLFMLTALISVNLGVLNLLPIPALDGGHIMFNLYEIIMRKPPKEAVYIKMTYVGWALLLSLMAFTIVNDILRLSGAYQ
ncbi:RIP metalloprotease RseP [Sulfurospirillum sp. T05]|uniref:Zinc metalloprotease n=1 Tax=Sulfurospirillum tamanense TaxID=2813362 RepID=A0ABS2WR87_9BACT|nr:RIP metalloprotease RseP [Sulfurospirillum tamanensis]MBN2964135.1 RIP metalloprotease RseP [Sulfurospirillum tamanensis]